MKTLFGLVGTLATGLLTMVIWELWGDSLLRIVERSSFRVSGWWLASFAPPSPHGSHSLEIVKLRQIKERVSVYLENYNTSRTSVLKVRGFGKYRGSQLAFVYHFVGGEKIDLGAMVMRTRSTDQSHPVLVGYYSQFVDRHGYDELKMCIEPYLLIPVKLPVLTRIKKIFRQPYFDGYKHLSEWATANGIDLEQLMKENEALANKHTASKPTWVQKQ